jgi:hypothetical protein
MITNQSTIEAANTYYMEGQAAKLKCLYLHPAGQFFIQANSRSVGKEVSVLNGARMFINVFARTYHWLMSKHTISITSTLILSYHLRLRSSVLCYKRHSSHLTELHSIKMYNLVYARNKMQ